MGALFSNCVISVLYLSYLSYNKIPQVGPGYGFHSASGMALVSQLSVRGSRAVPQTTECFRWTIEFLFLFLQFMPAFFSLSFLTHISFGPQSWSLAHFLPPPHTNTLKNHHVNSFLLEFNSLSLSLFPWLTIPHFP